MANTASLSPRIRRPNKKRGNNAAPFSAGIAAPLSPGVAAVSASLRRSPHRNEPAIVAVSGGRDSVALLHLLVSAGWTKLVACHLNHGLRGRESGQDAAWVRRLASRLGLVCEVERADVAALAKSSRQSVEVAGREARHSFLDRMARKHGAGRVFLAHHADDQAETILGNLCRGAGLRGVGGMKEEARGVSGVLLVRPLLAWRRNDIDAYAAAHSLEYREDSSNAARIHRRNRLRHEVMPLLNNVFQRDTAAVIARFGAQAARDDECLSQMAISFLEQQDRRAGNVKLPISAELKALHPAILSRVLAIWLRDRLSLPGIDHDVVEAARGLLSHRSPAKINLPGGRHLRRRARELFVTPG